MNVAYKHLNSKPKIGEFTFGQWAAMFSGLLVMFVWGFWISPLGGDLTLITAVYLGGLPIALALVASFAELNLWRFGRSAWNWALANGRYTPGPGDQASGYAITPDPRAERAESSGAHRQLDLSALWG